MTSVSAYPIIINLNAEFIKVAVLGFWKFCVKLFTIIFVLLFKKFMN